MLTVSRSNDMLALVQRLRQRLDEPRLRGGKLVSPLTPEVVLIQSAGMERWLSRELSSARGILAGVTFPFPRAFLVETMEQALAQAGAPVEGPLAFERERLVWSILSVLETHADAPELELVRTTLRADEEGTERYFLAERLAHLFDQYATFRPELLESFLGSDHGAAVTKRRLVRSGAEEAIFSLEAFCFRKVVERHGPHYFSARARRFLHDVDDEVLRSVLPPRLSLVGGAGLPPLFLHLLERIGRVIDVQLFSFSPSGEYFAELFPKPSEGDDEPAEVGQGAHPLLVSLGRVGGDYQHVLEDIRHVDDKVPFRRASSATLLGHLQNDIESAELRTEPLPPEMLADGSITFVSCHGPRREVEALHDQILDWFTKDPTLRAEDIVVLLPDVERYAPLIHAVFETKKPSIFFRVADRSERATSAAARTLLRGLELLNGRLKVSDVLDFLQLEPVLTRFGIDGRGLERIGEWVVRAGIRWGADGAHKAEYGLPNNPDNTWARGLERLLLGYVLADDGEGLFRGIVPVDDVGASEGDLLGRFAEFVTELLRFAAETRRHRAGRSPAELGAFVVSFARAFIGVPSAESDGKWDLGALLRSVESVFERPTSVGVDRPIPEAVALHLLSRELERERPSTDFLAGGVTFCELLPLRTIPFKNIVVLGLELGRFPREDRTDELDLLARAPRPGDRTLRSDDRYLFLEVLLSAREKLQLSYVGRSIQDDSLRPASVVVDELRRTLLAMVKAPRGAEGVPLVEHPLQPFSASYFREHADGNPDTGPSTAGPSVNSPRTRGGLVSYDQSLFRAALAHELGVEAASGVDNAEGARIAPFFVPRSVPSDRPPVLALSLEELARFWENPAKAFLRALEIRIDDSVISYEDREPVIEGHLDRYHAGDALLGLLEQGKEPRQAVELARGILPVGAGGALAFQRHLSDARGVFELGKAWRTGTPREVEIDVLVHPSESRRSAEFSLDALAPVRLVGAERLFETPDERGVFRAVEVRFSRLSARRLVRGFVRHVVLAGAGHVVETILIGRPKGGSNQRVVRFSPLELGEARELLPLLVGHFSLGKDEPLPFFAEESQRFFEEWKKAEATESSLPLEREDLVDVCFQKAFSASRAPDEGSRGESGGLSPEVRLAFRGMEPPLGFDASLRRRFVALSALVFAPLFEISGGK